MSKFFKFGDVSTNYPNELYQVLSKAMEDTMAVCIASSSALLVNVLTHKILPGRMQQYIENSHTAIQSIGTIRTWLLKLSQHLKDNKIAYLDARAPLKQVISQCMAGNCEHQSFYLAVLLRQQGIPALIYQFEDIDHCVVIANNFLLDPWAGMIFSLGSIIPGQFYGSTNLKASWLNRLLSNTRLDYPDNLVLPTRDELTDCLPYASRMGA